jgi:hypothetical protein
MPDQMTREQQVAAFLKRHRGIDYCDDWIARSLGMNRHQARNATSGLGATQEFNRGDRLCSACQKGKRVIHAR